MDSYDYVEVKRPPSASGSQDLIWNVLTILVLLATFICGLAILSILVNPNSALNPFPPPTMPERVVLPTATVTPRFKLEPTWTPEPTPEPSLTPTQKPTSTVFLTEVPAGPVTETPTASPTLKAGQFSFVLQQGSPQAIPNVIRTEAGCNWMGVAGQAFSLNKSPVVGLFIQLGGTLNGQLFETLLSMTGTAIEYGQGGYEFVIADKPIASSKTLWVQLLDQSNMPLSDKIYFDTYAECEKNLILINFTQVK